MVQRQGPDQYDESTSEIILTRGIMQATNVPCPHCRNQVYNDGRFAGQIVQCPTCQQQFQMPGQVTVVTPTVAAPTQNPFAFGNTPTSTASRYVAPRPKPSVLPWVIVGGAILLLGGGGIVFYAMQSKDASSAKQTVSKNSKSAELVNEQVAREKLNKVLSAWATGQSSEEFHKNNPDIIKTDGNSFDAILYVPQSFVINAVTESQEGNKKVFNFLVMLTYQSKQGQGVNKASTYTVRWMSDSKQWLISSKKNG